MAFFPREGKCDRAEPGTTPLAIIGAVTHATDVSQRHVQNQHVLLTRNASADVLHID